MVILSNAKDLLFGRLLLKRRDSSPPAQNDNSGVVVPSFCQQIIEHLQFLRKRESSVVVLTDEGKSKDPGFPIKDVGNDSREKTA